ncbi:MAG: histidine phosphatase family protein [Oscillospiraceae bacterium]|nr:histidine phosphatase family protein [Oscillospiraceae bacterium]
MRSYKIHFIRHGFTKANLNGQYIGITDMPICEEGFHQLEEMRSYNYPNVEKVYSSPLERCLQTALYLFDGVEIMNISELREMDLGDFEGKTLEEMKDDLAFNNWLRDNMNNPPPNGENGRDYVERLVKGLDKVIRDMMDQQVFEAAVVLSGTAIMTVMALMAFPRRPMGEWNCPCGAGFTALITPQIWLRDRVFEEFGSVPYQQDETDPYWLAQKAYENGDGIDFDDDDEL